MESPVIPHDMLFRAFYYLGYCVILAVVIAGAVVTYDWWKEKKEREAENGQN